jgi:hypothetical protein
VQTRYLPRVAESLARVRARHTFAFETVSRAAERYSSIEYRRDRLPQIGIEMLATKQHVLLVDDEAQILTALEDLQLGARSRLTARTGMNPAQRAATDVEA